MVGEMARWARAGRHALVWWWMRVASKVGKGGWAHTRVVVDKDAMGECVHMLAKVTKMNLPFFFLPEAVAMSHHEWVMSDKCCVLNVGDCFHSG